MAKGRFFVAFEEDSGSNNSKIQKKFVVSVDREATNPSFRKRLPTLNRESDSDNFVLELPGGFELRPQNLVQDTIREDELVTTRVNRKSCDKTANQTDSVKPTHSSPPVLHHITEPNEPSRIQIRLVSAELAWRHASSLKNGVESDIEGVLAFEGQFIRGISLCMHSVVK